MPICSRRLCNKILYEIRILIYQILWGGDSNAVNVASIQHKEFTILKKITYYAYMNLDEAKSEIKSVI